jgi:hypothetical protein
MYFELSIHIRRRPEEVFAFLRDKDRYPQPPGSPVLALVKTTSGPPQLGTQYREVVQMLPFVRGEILSELTRVDRGKALEEDFHGANMKGHLAYEFRTEGEGTNLIQRETLQTVGLLRFIAPVIRWALARRLTTRLQGIKTVLESD